MIVKSKKIRDSARGENCTLMLDGCLHSTETVVLCHAPGTGMKGTGMKCPDIFAFYGCMHCHSVVDGRTSGEWTYKDIVRAMAETQMKFIEKGLMVIK